MGLNFSRLFASWFGPAQARIVLLGLDAAGKTTILYKLKLSEVVTTIPTIGFNVEEIQFQNLNMTVWDVGGQESIRALWKHYLRDNDALVYAVDSSDKERFEKAKEELWALLNFDEMRNTTVLILANKQDLPGAASTSAVAEAMDLPRLRNGRPWFVQACCATNGQGLVEGFDWMATKIKERRKSGHRDEGYYYS